MAPQDRDRRISPKEAFAVQMPDLVRTAFNSNPKNKTKARFARQALAEGIGAESTFDLGTQAIPFMQEQILAKTTAQETAIAVDRMTFVCTIATAAIEEREGDVIITATPVTKAAIEKILANEKKLAAKRIKIEDTAYAFINRSAGQRLLSSEDEGAHVAFLTDPKAKINTEALTQWSIESRKLAAHTEKRDELVDHLKEEPEIGKNKERFFTRNIDGLSFADIVDMHYPLSAEDYTRLTDYFVHAFGDTETTATIRMQRNSVLAALLFNVTLFKRGDEPINYKYHNLFMNLNRWQEYFFASCFTEETGLPETAQDLFTRLPGYFFETAAQSLGYWAMFAEQSNPDTKDSRYIDSEEHPLFIKGIYAYKTYYTNALFWHEDEIAATYYDQVLLPSFTQRVHEAGLFDKFAREIGLEHRKVERYMDIRADTFAANFAAYAGPDFVDRITTQSGAIAAVTQDIWQSLIKGQPATSSTQEDEGLAVQFLPLEEGVEFIDFKEGDPERIIGIESIGFHRLKTIKDTWETEVQFLLRNGHVFDAIINAEGKLHTMHPYRNTIPGPIAILENVAVSALHDIMVQQKKSQQRKTAQVEDQTEPLQEITKTRASERSTAHSTLPRRSRSAKKHYYFSS